MNTETQNAPTESPEQANDESTFRSIFSPPSASFSLKVPDYQRAYSWEETQIELFIDDLKKFHRSGHSYYYGHFIAEKQGKCWEIVDGQQRITTFVLFLLVCRHHSKVPIDSSAESLIQRFSTVTYDKDALDRIVENLTACLERHDPISPKAKLDGETIKKIFSLEGDLTRSLKRMLLALLQFNRAFVKGALEASHIDGYIEVVMAALCSHHITQSKTVAVNIFEMHNTRGVALTTLEKVKACLMRSVFEKGKDEKDRYNKVTQIQEQFGEIYRMEEHLAERSFRGEMTMDQLLRLHLRVIDDGHKTEVGQFHSPPINADGSAMVAYIEKRLRYKDDEQRSPKSDEESVIYATNLANELRKSVWIMSTHLYEWDKSDPLVGDVLILERDLSCEFFLIICRRLEKTSGQADGHIDHKTLILWERFLFTRNLHEAYYRLRYTDDFPRFFAQLGQSEIQIFDQITGYLADGFRSEKTQGLQLIVTEYLNANKENNVLGNAFYWWKEKMKYAIYKYEISLDADLRDVMKGTISVEHILPQGWHWIKEDDDYLKEMTPESLEEFNQKINSRINSIGNLLLITPGENTSEGNRHPAEKKYQKYCAGGSYKEHDENRDKWRHPDKWKDLIDERGEKIFKFMLKTLVGVSGESQTTPDALPKLQSQSEELPPNPTPP